MTEKDLDSMATVQMKPDYAPSEVYSTASEPPPAYKRKANSVQIAKIVAFTVIVSSMIIGCFILASAYLQARASCDQIQALDSVLEKELMLETLQQELPRAEALIGKDNDDGIELQNLDHDEKSNKKDKEMNNNREMDKNDKDNSESSYSENDEADDLQKAQMKVPLELDLSDLAAALLQSNQKSRMNCVIERKHAEEYVDSPSKVVNLPFGMNLSTDPKKAKITGERISIFCDGGDESREKANKEQEQEDETENIRPSAMFIPIQRLPIPFGATPQHNPLTHMPQRMMPPQMMHQMGVPPFQHMQFQRPPPPPPPQHLVQQMLPQMQSPQVLQSIRPNEPQLRIQVQRIPIREIRLPQSFQQLPFPIREFPSPSSSASSASSSQQQSNEMPQIHVQRLPLGEALQRAGITSDDLRNIQRMAEERISDELRRLAVEEAVSSSDEASDSSTNNSSEVDEDNESTDPQIKTLQTQQPPKPDENMRPPMSDQSQILQIGRSAYGRSLPTPVRIPVPMMQALADEASNTNDDSGRPHFVHPRSVRSAENPLTEKRVKRCACDCAC